MRPMTVGFRGAIVALALIIASPARAQFNIPTTITNLSGFGIPLDGILVEAAQGHNDDLATFADGQLTFTEVDSLPELGPIFNSRSCGACHFQPALGGSGQFINEVRVRNNTAGGPLHIFASDNILRAGPQKQGTTTIFPAGLESTPLGCQITAPKCTQSVCQTEEASRTTFVTTLKICNPTSSAFLSGTNCTAERQSTPLFGFGLVEAVANSTFVAIANSQPLAIRGTVKTVVELGATRVARFGWKDDVATLRGFAADAYLNEIGITNPDAPNERSSCALGVTKFGVLLDAADDPRTRSRPTGAPTSTASRTSCGDWRRRRLSTRATPPRRGTRSSTRSGAAAATSRASRPPRTPPPSFRRPAGASPSPRA